MTADGDGWWTRRRRSPLDADSDYGFLLDDDPNPLPDPRSRRQPTGRPRPVPRLRPVPRSRGPTTAGRVGSWPAAIVYELHLGTFTPGGTLDAAIDQLDHLVDLGIDFVELLPVNGFNGTHNWGYDGVLWYAVDDSYGGPEAYQRFVDACHGRGPRRRSRTSCTTTSGRAATTCPRFGPYLHDERSNTWGASINLDSSRGAPLHPRQRGDVDARLPRRRAAPRCRARPGRHIADAHPAGARRGDRRPRRRSSAGR